MVKININLSNRWLYSILAVIIVVLAGVAVWAATPGVSHSLDELTGDGTIAGTLTISGGNVGIGITSPTTRFQISTASANSNLWVREGGDYGAGYSGVAIDARDDANAVNMLIITGSPTVLTGNVGIGTPTLGAKLDVAGDIKATGTICDSVGCIGAGGGGEWTTCTGGICYAGGNIKLETSGKCIIFESGGRICSGT